MKYYKNYRTLEVKIPVVFTYDETKETEDDCFGEKMHMIYETQDIDTVCNETWGVWEIQSDQTEEITENEYKKLIAKPTIKDLSQVKTLHAPFIKIGDRVKVIDQDITGTVVRVYAHTLVIADDDAEELNMEGLELEYRFYEVQKIN